MTPTEFVSTVLDPGLAWCAELPSWKIRSDDRARVLLTAISGQEADWTDRIQGGRTPAAHGLFQFERMGGVHGVLHFPATAHLAMAVCVKAGVPADENHVWGVLATEKGDNLAVAFARLNLWTDPNPLPQVGDEDGSWLYYTRIWRPGAVAEGGQRAADARDRWGDVYSQAIAVVSPSA